MRPFKLCYDRTSGTLAGTTGYITVYAKTYDEAVRWLPYLIAVPYRNVRPSLLTLSPSV